MTTYQKCATTVSKAENLMFSYPCFPRLQPIDIVQLPKLLYLIGMQADNLAFVY